MMKGEVHFPPKFDVTETEHISKRKHVYGIMLFLLPANFKLGLFFNECHIFMLKIC